MTKKIQNQLDNYIRGNSKRIWIKEDLLYTSKEKGGIGFLNLTKFIDAIRITWIRRYEKGTSDHWCDILGNKLGLNEWNREKVWKMGNQCFDEVSKMKLHGLSSIVASCQKFVKAFPQPVEKNDNTWFCQALFRNSNIKTKIPNRRGTEWKIRWIDPEYLSTKKPDP